MTIISNDAVQIAIVPETVAGQTPTTPAFLVVRHTGETIQFAPTSQDDQELSGGSNRCQRPSVVTGTTVSGNINFDLHRSDWLDAAIASVMAGEWGKCPETELPGGIVVDTDDLVVGEKLQTFTLEKKIPDPASPGSYLYHRFSGVSFSLMTLNIIPNQPVTGSFGVVGGVPSLSDTELAGATYAPAGNGPKFFAPGVTELSVGSELAVGTNCFLSSTLTLDSQNRGVQCIGSQGDREVVLGNLAASMAGEVYFADNDILQAMLDQSNVGHTTVILTNANDEKYRFDLFSCKVTNATASANATGQDFTQPLTVEPDGATVCGNWGSCVFVSKKDTAPTLP